MSYSHYRKRVENLVGSAPVFDPGKPPIPQVLSWLAWSERYKMQGRFEDAQRREDERTKKASPASSGRAAALQNG